MHRPGADQLAGLAVLAMCLGLCVGCGGNAGSGAGGTGASSGGTGGGGGTANPGVSVAVADDRIRVRQGGSINVSIGLERTGGFEGAVAIEVSGLPANVTAAPLTIGAGSVSAMLEVTAEPEANPGGPIEVDVTATAPDSSAVSATVPTDLYVAGPPGSLDTSFSFDGVALYSVTDEGYDDPRDLVIDREGRLLVVGQRSQAGGPYTGWLVRFLPDGTIDSSFGIGGEVMGFENGAPDSAAQAIVLREGDTPLVLVSSYDSGIPGSGTPYIRALLSDGTPDTTYGSGGDVESTAENPRRLLSRPSGVVVYGYGDMAALDPEGSPIDSFVLPLLTPTNFGVAVGDTQDRIVFGGFGADGGQNFTLGRLLPDGALDGDFGAAGALSTPIPIGQLDGLVNDIALLDDDGGVALAQSRIGNVSEQRPVLIRFDSNGVLDAGFGSGGVATVLAATELGFGVAVALQDDGVMIVCGAINLGTSTSNDPVVKRFNPDGSIDPSFGTDGQVATDRIPVTMVRDARGGRVVVLARQPPPAGGIHLTRIWL